MLAYAFLVAICVQEHAPSPGASASPAALPAPALISLTPCEVRHLLARLFFPAPTSVPLIWQ